MTAELAPDAAPVAPAPPVAPVRLAGPAARPFFLLADEDPAEFRLLAEAQLHVWAPRDALERDFALAILWAAWRQGRADRLETQVLEQVMASGKGLIEPGHNRAFALALRYRRQLAQECRLAEQALA